MRCLGLTGERRRCEAEAVGMTGYCESHRSDPARLTALHASAHTNPSGLLELVSKLRGSAPVPSIQDPARFGVPAWLRRRPTAGVAQILLEHPDATVRWAAAFTLRKRRDPAAVEPLWEALREDVSGSVRQQSAVALGKIGAPAVLGPLIEGLWHDPDAGVRQACAIALGNLGLAHAVRDLASVLEREEAVFVRWDCILALGQLGDHTVEPVLAQWAERERAPVVRQACAEARASIRRRAQRN